MISFEFTPEFIDATLNSIRYLADLGMVEYNYSEGELMSLVLDNGVLPEEMILKLRNLPKDVTTFGDVYARSTKI